ncbi:uncharacterized protein MONOS_3185 [Monocercomonoides exilis]|uniref:uncharacterized protein n=1 Tax=Monocercomonoides exilis TaxID=2049356 RepID=UPI003559E219|nr:hypothetical protein MONOS_3185 [Monocercomonoides exilis]|eukprot:MONOS_3185.1-p1 / transcript=MONOS_3185.1 / gene=MONOS_3185 / organism=Monocercomonoides_exilis_PA203 / gene_product=unspecified product / transcript_product=unspecified product / location=Mono_scaffold00073:7637-8755(+) / protein_length=373 / sequence_SO=supercontig / SO=protein_coding / is_pseudo=false
MKSVEDGKKDIAPAKFRTDTKVDLSPVYVSSRKHNSSKQNYFGSYVRENSEQKINGNESPPSTVRFLCFKTNVEQEQTNTGVQLKLYTKKQTNDKVHSLPQAKLLKLSCIISTELLKLPSFVEVFSNATNSTKLSKNKEAISNSDCCDLSTKCGRIWSSLQSVLPDIDAYSKMYCLLLITNYLHNLQVKFDICENVLIQGIIIYHHLCENIAKFGCRPFEKRQPLFVWRTLPSGSDMMVSVEAKDDSTLILLDHRLLIGTCILIGHKTLEDHTLASSWLGKYFGISPTDITELEFWVLEALRWETMPAEEEWEGMRMMLESYQIHFPEKFLEKHSIGEGFKTTESSIDNNDVCLLYDLIEWISLNGHYSTYT